MPKSRNLEGSRYAVSRPFGKDRGPTSRPRSLVRSITRSKYGKSMGFGFLEKLLRKPLDPRRLAPGKGSP